MKIPRGDGGKPIQVGDPSYIYEGIYNPIVWVGNEPYRPRVETLVIQDGCKVFLRIYDKPKNGCMYTLPGGSLDADSTKAEQAENETNEEALVSIKDIHYSGIQYYDRYQPGFNRSGGHSPIEYVGTINDVFVAAYDGPYDKSKVEPKDLDPDIAENGKFHPICDVISILRPEHIRALSECGLVNKETKTKLLVEASDRMTKAATESMNPDFDAVLPPGEYIYHGSKHVIDTFHPMSIDFGNAKQKPGWSTFCFADPVLALRFGLMRTIQDAIGDKYKCEWNFKVNKPYLIMYQAKEVIPLIRGLKFYVYTIATEGLDIGIGNDIRFPEYTFREDNVKPQSVNTYTIDDPMIDTHIEMMDLICVGGYEEEISKDKIFKERHYAAFINRDYDHDPVIKKVVKAVGDGELKPGDDIEEYMMDHDLIPEEVQWEKITEATGIKLMQIAMTPDNLNDYRTKYNKTMLRHVRTPDERNAGAFLVAPSGALAGYVMVDHKTKFITALEVEKRYRGLGVGKDLLDLALGVGAKYLSVNKKNTAAINLYKKWNWEVYKEDGTMLYMKAPGTTFTMEGYCPVDESFTAMVPVTEKRLTAAERKNLSNKDYGIPSQRKYPMPDKKHVLAAIKMFNKVDPKYEKQLANNILKKIKEFGMEEVVSVSKDNKFSKYAPKTMLESMEPVAESYSPLYFYHVVPKDHLGDNLVTLGYLYDNKLWGMFDDYADKYRDRICNAWKYYDKKPEDLTREEIVEGLKRFRKADNLYQSYFFRYPPSSSMGTHMASILENKDIYRIDINDRVVQRYIESIDWGYECSNSNNQKLTKRYYETVRQEDYFKNYDDSKSMNFAALNHISITFKSGYIPFKYLEKIDEPVQESSYREDDVIYQNYERFTSGECNYCFVTGLSGSGKSTLTKSLCEKNKALWIELDLFSFAVTKWKDKSSIMWSKDYPFLYYMKTRPDLCKLAETATRPEWKEAVYNEKETRAFVRFLIDWCREQPNKKYVIEGVQIFIFCDNSILSGEPLVFIDRSVARSYRQRIKREVHDWDSFVRELKMTPGVMQYYMADAMAKSNFKDDVLEVTVENPQKHLISVDNKIKLDRNIKTSNYDKWQSGTSNVIWVTGMSGSGKSTLAEQIAAEYNAEFVQLDWAFEDRSERPDDILKGFKPTLSRGRFGADEVNQACTELISHVKRYLGKHKDKKYVIDGVQIFYADDNLTKMDPVVIVDYPMTRVMAQRFKRDVALQTKMFIKQITNRWLDIARDDFDYDNDGSMINVLDRYKDNILESTFIDIDEIEPGYGEKSYGTPPDRTVDNNSSRELESHYTKFVVAQYLHHGEYYGLTDWEDSISKYVTKKNYGMGLYYVYGSNNGYPEYIGQILLDDKKNWHWYEAVKPMAVTEAWDNHDKDVRVLEDLVNDLRTWRYGYVFQGKPYDITDEEEFILRYKTLTYSEFEKYKCGTCFDYTNYIYHFLSNLCEEDEEQFQVTCYYIDGTDEDGDHPCHTFPIVRLRNGRYYWLETSWKQACGLYEYSSISNALKDIVDKWLDGFANLNTYSTLCSYIPRAEFEHIACIHFMRLLRKNTNMKI